MAEQVIDIRERIEKMRIKFEDDHKSDIHDEPNLEKNVSFEEKKGITNLENDFGNKQKEEIKSNYNNDLSKSKTYQNQKLYLKKVKSFLQFNYQLKTQFLLKF